LASLSGHSHQLHHFSACAPPLTRRRAPPRLSSMSPAQHAPGYPTTATNRQYIGRATRRTRYRCLPENTTALRSLAPGTGSQSKPAGGTYAEPATTSGSSAAVTHASSLTCRSAGCSATPFCSHLCRSSSAALSIRFVFSEKKIGSCPAEIGRDRRRDGGRRVGSWEPHHSTDPQLGRCVARLDLQLWPAARVPPQAAHAWRPQDRSRLTGGGEQRACRRRSAG